MKYLITFLILLIGISNVYADWLQNPFTQSPDYYEPGSGVSVIPQPYQSDPTVTSLRDLLNLIGIMGTGYAYAGWYNNPFTRKPDYYEDESGVTPIPQPYQAVPTVITLRDLLVTVGIMARLPHGEVWQDVEDEVWQDMGNEVWQDYTN